MKLRLTRFTWRLIKAVAFSLAGALVVLIIGFVLFLDSRPDLDVWHLANLNEEFRADAGVETFADYLALEERLFAQLDALVYRESGEETEYLINRYDRGSLSTPALVAQLEPYLSAHTQGTGGRRPAAPWDVRLPLQPACPR